jgi:hypothetical protein
MKLKTKKGEKQITIKEGNIGEKQEGNKNKMGKIKERQKDIKVERKEVRIRRQGEKAITKERERNAR